MSAAGAVESGIVGQQKPSAGREEAGASGHMAAHDKFLLEEEEYEYATFIDFRGHQRANC